ncbi:Xylose isomerase domain-containing protein TIM barrel [Thiorhodococcus drewsii AZ1]|uniref:Xylose isomerase domain-containing protein TIM barrel n=1 Tax=Thiorhodococcus drewsii AZ1 TaxID=765913 RepID=G2E4M2_9GAMM|nr:TIM barrel protein [Thiorhodococcus drewsii]EGV29643.1 Xylose isomerase domain-containing protein TIM barrel [Thiorhodococcus drewsii AZ1]
MSSFGYKIIDSSRAELEPIVASALALGTPVEVGLYTGDGESFAFLEESLRESGLPVVVHLDHRRLGLFGLERREAALREQLGQAVRLGARDVITHCSPYPMTVRRERQAEVLTHLLGGLKVAVAACADHALGLHIENTYHDLSFYRSLFQAITSAELDGVDFCFDIGHAKLWSTRTLAEWMGLLRDFDLAGRRIHFHLHANGGLQDDHLSFLTADHLGLSTADAFTAPGDYYQALAQIAESFPSSLKVFEVPASEAIENRTHVIKRIAAYATTAINHQI